jgi:hypothetical protein
MDNALFSYTVHSDYLFDKSPEITVSSPWEFVIEDLRKFESVRKCVRRVPSMSWMSHLRRSSCRQRDGHIFRLTGMQRLCEMITYSLTFYSGCIWEFRVLGKEIDFLKVVIGHVSDHPCVALARNDMLYMRLWNHHARRGRRIGGTPDGNLLRFAGDRCLYCSDKFDSFTSQVIRRKQLRWDHSLTQSDLVAGKAPWLYQRSSSRLAELEQNRDSPKGSCVDHLLSTEMCEYHRRVECFCSFSN